MHDSLILFIWGIQNNIVIDYWKKKNNAKSIFVYKILVNQ